MQCCTSTCRAATAKPDNLRTVRLSRRDVISPRETPLEMTMWQGFAVEQIPGMSGAGKILPCGPFFYGADLSGISLTGPLGVNLANANLIGSDLTNSTLIQANFHEANLGGANLTGAKLARAQLPARLSSIVGFMAFRHGTSKWTTTPLQTASRKAVLILGRFSDKRKPNFAGA